MIATYPEHDGIEIESAAGVCMAGKDTLAIATCAAAVPASNAIDIGTGTGFIAIFLAGRGVSCLATDIDDAALENARANVARNGVDVECLSSDLFENVSGTYDLIVFNTPLVAVGATYSGLVRDVRRRLPVISSLIGHVAFLRKRSSRRRLLERFEEGVLRHSNDRTHVVLLLHQSEVRHFARYAPCVFATHARFFVTVFAPHRRAVTSATRPPGLVIDT